MSKSEHCKNCPSCGRGSCQIRHRRNGGRHLRYYHCPDWFNQNDDLSMGKFSMYRANGQGFRMFRADRDYKKGEVITIPLIPEGGEV